MRKETQTRSVAFLICYPRIRAGAAGCPLAQTLVEGGQKVLLVERGPERFAATENVNTLQDAIFGPCTETFSSRGVSDCDSAFFLQR